MSKATERLDDLRKLANLSRLDEAIRLQNAMAGVLRVSLTQYVPRGTSFHEALAASLAGVEASLRVAGEHIALECEPIARRLKLEGRK
jgi:hypothetical protein